MSSAISFSTVYRLTLLPIPWIITVTAAIRTLLNIMNTQYSGDIPWTLEQWISTINMTRIIIIIIIIIKFILAIDSHWYHTCHSYYTYTHMYMYVVKIVNKYLQYIIIIINRLISTSSPQGN